MYQYFNRQEAGKVLAEQLQSYAKNANTIVLALPRGGVPVAYEIAKSLSLPLDVFIVRKLGVPGFEELAFGAIASNEIMEFNKDVLNDCGLSQPAMDEVIRSERQELQRRELAYRGNRPFPVLKDKIIILVDDGIATGATMRVAIKALRQQHPAEIVIAVPVAALSTYDEMKRLANKIFCPLTPDHFYAVGSWYEHFDQTSDEEVFDLLHKNAMQK
ncbi:MAG: phosphoribosyltransferase [Gammaproteobacteria bacterium]|nr:phosphoribosyltransferase [Gammaproteobacteria bacterium]